MSRITNDNDYWSDAESELVMSVPRRAGVQAIEVPTCHPDRTEETAMKKATRGRPPTSRGPYMATTTLAKQTRTTIESAKADLDLGLRNRTTSSTLRQCRYVNAIQVMKAFVTAVEGGISLPGEEVTFLVTLPTTDENLLGWWKVVAQFVRTKFSARTKGRSGFYDFETVVDVNGKPLKPITIKGKRGKPDCSTTPLPLMTDRDFMDESKLFDVERRITADWSDLFGFLIESLDEQKQPRRTTRRGRSRRC